MEGLTSQYSTPEQFNSEEYGSVDKRTDIYQLGTVLYELYTGAPVFEGRPAEVMHQVTNREPTPPTGVDQSLPERLDDVLLEALQKRKLDRHERVTYLRDELQKLDDSLTSG